MADLGSLVAVGFAGFAAGVAYASRGHVQALRLVAAAGAIVIDVRAYRLVLIEHEDAANELRLRTLEGMADRAFAVGGE